jgi:hypothetical protein
VAIGLFYTILLSFLAVGFTLTAIFSFLDDNLAIYDLRSAYKFVALELNLYVGNYRRGYIYGGDTAFTIFCSTTVLPVLLLFGNYFFAGCLGPDCFLIKLLSVNLAIFSTFA